MAKKKCPECPAIPKWMTTYSDLMSLLLTFFVLLLTMASMDTKKLQEAFPGTILTGGSGILPGSNSILDRSINKPFQSSKAQTAEAVNAVKTYIESQGEDQSVTVKQTSKGFTVTLLDSLVFDSNSYSIKPSSFPILDNIASVASTSSYNISVEGHSDDQNNSSDPYYNWDLSSNRALSVLKYLVTAGVQPEKVSAVGFGEYHPLLPNITEQNRAKNRRVVINFISQEYAESDKGNS